MFELVKINDNMFSETNTNSLQHLRIMGRKLYDRNILRPKQISLVFDKIDFLRKLNNFQTFRQMLIVQHSSKSYAIFLPEYYYLLYALEQSKERKH